MEKVDQYLPHAVKTIVNAAHTRLPKSPRDKRVKDDHFSGTISPIKQLHSDN
ncbi:MAG TPA: hypothetical protein VL461_06940 [Dictyobacter sp.]|nr:hypothetical protein [Dictyobacter sp.]